MVRKCKLNLETTFAGPSQRKSTDKNVYLHAVARSAAFWAKYEAQLQVLGWGPRPSTSAVTSNDAATGFSQELLHAPYMQHLSNPTVLSTGDVIATAPDWDTCTCPSPLQQRRQLPTALLQPRTTAMGLDPPRPMGLHGHGFPVALFFVEEETTEMIAEALEIHVQARGSVR